MKASFSVALATAAVLSLFLNGRASAQSTDTALESVVITATRVPEPSEQTLASVSVITRADIERLQPHSVAELLSGLAGVATSNNGGLGKETSVFLRGTESDEVLVLIDGIRVGSVTTGTTAFEQIPVDQIERIEIVRGPRSSLYGSDAIGGVIQIFTRQGSGAATPSFSVSGGAYDTWKEQAGLSGSDGHAWYSLSVSSLYTNGFNICAADAPTFAACYTTQPHKNGYWDLSASVRGGYSFDSGLGLSADWLRAYGDTHYAGDYVNSSKEAQQVLGGTIKLPTVGIWSSSVTGGQSQDESNDYEDGVYVDTYDSRRNSASWLNQLAFSPEQTFTAGIDYLQDVALSNTPYNVESRYDEGEFGQYQGIFGPVEAQLSARHDHDQQFGEHSTGALAAGYAFSDTVRATASYASAFEAPTFNDLYFPFYGNPDLKPVSSHSTEVGLLGNEPNLRWSLAAYETRVDDLIVYDTATFGPANIDRTLIRGIEGQLGTSWNGWRNQLSGTLLDPRDRTPGDNDTLLPRRPRRTLRYDLDRQIEQMSVGASWFVSGPTFDDLANTAPIGGYSTLDLRAGYQIDQSWQLQLQLSNVLNKNYETAQYYNQPGRALYLTLRYHPASK